MALWSNLFSMLEDVRKRVQAGEQVAPVDDALRLRLGFRSDKGGEWDIDLVAARHAEPRSIQEERLCELFRTLEGRRQLLRHFKRGSLRKTIWEHLKESH